MRVLSVASEIYPLVKTGGLADVAGALPPAMARLGVEMRTLVPGYPAVMNHVTQVRAVHPLPPLLGVRAQLLETMAGEVALYVLDAPELFDRPGGIYLDPANRDWGDNWRRFAAFCRAGAEIARGAAPGFLPDLVHAHDWQAGLAPVYLRYYGIPTPSVITIHNLAFQGWFPPEVFWAIELPGAAFALDGVEYFGGVGYLKGGLVSASAITTVSPTYAAEIRTPPEGMALDGLLRTRARAVHGIVNGIDTEVWNPETDPVLAAPFSRDDLAGRSVNRAAVEAAFGLDPGAGPLFCVISRLTGQKGMDLVVAVAPALAAAGGRLAVLGSGERWIEDALLALSDAHPGRIGVRIGYDEPLAHRMQGGCDAILIPSRFEPCGLTQLYGLRYGCVPIVTRVGGLADTVIDANVAALKAGVATGFQIEPENVDALHAALLRAIELFGTPDWTAMQRAGMGADVSWDRSAALYADLYRSLAPDVKA